MALLDFQQQFLGRNKMWGATAGVADLPTTGLPGDWTVGDMVVNLNLAAIGQPAIWTCIAVTNAGNPSFGAHAFLRGTTAGKTVTPTYTLATTDQFILSGAGSIVLPASTTFPTYCLYYIHATASSVTLTPASGQINGAAASTLAANANLQIFTDGTTNWYSAN